MILLERVADTQAEYTIDPVTETVKIRQRSTGIDWHDVACPPHATSSIIYYILQNAHRMEQVPS